MVVDAVQCAAAIQWELKARNAELPDHRRMEFRIGINLLDVQPSIEGFGDGYIWVKADLPLVDIEAAEPNTALRQAASFSADRHGGQAGQTCLAAGQL